jgi:hypothetical protein
MNSEERLAKFQKEMQEFSNLVMKIWLGLAAFSFVSVIVIYAVLFLWYE